MREGWKEIRIKDLGQIITGNTPPRKRPELYGDHTLFVKPTDINIGEKYCYEPEECYSDLGFEKYKKSLIPKGATCVVTIGSIGKKMIMSHTDLFINQAMNAIIPFDDYDEHFVFYLLKLNLFQLKTFDSGTASGRENVSKSSFSNIKVIVPESKETQRKIATILSAYDDLIENNLKRIKLLEEKAQLTYEEWFVRMRFPGWGETAINEETGLPEGWCRSTFGDFVKTSSGGTPSKRKESEYYVNGTIPWIRTKELKDFILIDSEGKITEKGLKESSAKLFPENTVLLAMYGNTIGETSFLTFEACTNQACCALLVGENTHHSYFIHQYLLRNKEYVLSFRMGAAQENISQSIIKSIEIVLPREQCLIQFGEVIKPIYQLIKNLYLENRILKEARDILLPRLMTGMIDVEKIQITKESVFG